MASKLALYNQALRRLGERRLSSLTENRPPRHELDEVYADGFINELLESAHWNFATRTIEQTYESDIAPEFGYSRVFAKPTDWVKTSSFCSDEFFNSPISAYADETSYWSCGYDTIYVRYVSNDGEFGSDLGKWPPSFTRWAAVRLALLVAPQHVRGRSVLADLREEDKKLLIVAKSRDAVNEGAKFTPTGNWTRARMGGSRSRER